MIANKTLYWANKGSVSEVKVFVLVCTCSQKPAICLCCPVAGWWPLCTPVGLPHNGLCCNTELQVESGYPPSLSPAVP